MFCEPRLVFCSTEGVRLHFYVLRSRTYFRRYRGRSIPFSCFARSDSFSAVPRASRPVFKFYALQDSFSAVRRASGLVLMYCGSELVFFGTDGVRYLFHVLHARARFQRYRGHRVLFLCFARPDSFSRYRGRRVPFSSFFVPVLIFGGTQGVVPRFHVWRSLTLFRRYRGCRLPFSCFAHPKSFSTVP
jgi:hypothetical protein